MRTVVPFDQDEAVEKFGHQCALGVSTFTVCFLRGASPSFLARRAVMPASLRRTELALRDALFSSAKLPVTV